MRPIAAPSSEPSSDDREVNFQNFLQTIAKSSRLISSNMAEHTDRYADVNVADLV